jgi:hypothetical protein
LYLILKILWRVLFMDIKDSVTKCANLIGREFRDENGQLREGQISDGESIMAFKNGLLDGGDEPAYHNVYYHMEWFKAGQLHRDGDEPAIVHRDDNREICEYWKNGEFIKVDRRYV